MQYKICSSFSYTETIYLNGKVCGESFSILRQNDGGRSEVKYCVITTRHLYGATWKTLFTHKLEEIQGFVFTAKTKQPPGCELEQIQMQNDVFHT